MVRTFQLAMLALLLALPVLAQNPVEEAKSKISKQQHEAMVEHAKNLLERKASLEKQLAEIDAKLVKLANGEDVPDDTPASTVVTWGTSNTNNYCCSIICSSSSSIQPCPTH